MRSRHQDRGSRVRRVEAADPEARAGELADELSAALCTTAAEIDELLDDRRHVVHVDAAAIADLRTLASRSAKTSRIADRTRQRAVDEAGARLGGASGIAIHPDTVRERAARVDRARRDLLAAERAIEEHRVDASVEPLNPPTPPPAVAPVTTADEPASGPSMRVRRSQAVGALVASFGLALVLLALDVLPLWAALLLPLLAALWGLRRLRSPAHGSATGGEGPSLLSEVGAYTDEIFGARRAAREHDSDAVRLSAVRSRAEEEVRVAERAWRDLVGEDFDPAELEDVVRRFDPQHEDARLLADETAGVRATIAVVAQVRARWVERWEALSLTVPDLDEAEAAVAELARRVEQPVVVVGAAADRADEVAGGLPAASVWVVVGADAPVS